MADGSDIGSDLGIQTVELVPGVKVENRIRIKSILLIKKISGKDFKPFFDDLIETAGKGEPDIEAFSLVLACLHKQTDKTLTYEAACDVIEELTLETMLVGLGMLGELMGSEAEDGENPPLPGSQETPPAE